MPPSASVEFLVEMAKEPWTDPDPQPGDFDAALDHASIEIHDGNADAKLSILVGRGR